MNHFHFFTLLSFSSYSFPTGKICDIFEVISRRLCIAVVQLNVTKLHGHNTLPESTTALKFEFHQKTKVMVHNNCMVTIKGLG